MWEKWKKHLSIIISIFVLLVLMTLTIGSHYHSSIASFADRVFYPIQVVFKSLNNLGTSALENFRDFRNVQKERDQLLLEISKLKKLQIDNEELRRENSSLTQALDYQRQHPEISFAFSRVVMRDPSDWYQEITVDIGSINGIKEGMTVVAIQDRQIGLVGIVEEVFKYTSRVHLLVDPDKNVAAAAQVANKIMAPVLVEEPPNYLNPDPDATDPEPSTPHDIIWYQGVIEGSIQDQGTMEMIYITHEAEIELGSPVITTGLGGYYIPDIPVGTVTKLKKDAFGLQKRAMVKPYIDSSRLKDVMIITNPLPVKIAGQ